MDRIKSQELPRCIHREFRPEPQGTLTSRDLVEDDEPAKGAVKYGTMEAVRKNKCFMEGMTNGLKH